MAEYSQQWVPASPGYLMPSGGVPAKKLQLSGIGFNAQFQIEIKEFDVNDKDCVTFYYKLTPDLNNVETGYKARVSEDNKVFNEISWNSWNKYTTELYVSESSQQQIRLYFELIYHHRDDLNLIGNVLDIYVNIPAMVRINPIEFDYTNPVLLTATGENKCNISVINPNDAMIKLVGPFRAEGTGNTRQSYSSQESEFKTDFTYYSRDIGNNEINVTITNLPHKEVIHTYQEIVDVDYWWYYYIDSAGRYVARCNNNYWGNTFALTVSVVDNSDILSLLSCSLAAINSSTNKVSDKYLSSQTKIRLIYNFKYTGSESNKFDITLRTGNESLISTSVTGSARQYTGTLYSEVLDKARVMNPILEIRDKFGRVLTYDFGVIEVFYYAGPYLSSFDGYWSNSNGVMNLQSRYISILATFDYSELGGDNSLTQKLQLFDATDTSFAHPLITLDPQLVSGQRKYINRQLSQTVHYIAKLTLTDSLGKESSKTIDLNRSGNVVMDFGNQGYGLAIGKLNEQPALEINFPTVFYNSVEYVNGTRQRTDAASVLGCMDNYNVGATTIQDMLDYLVNKVLNG